MKYFANFLVDVRNKTYKLIVKAKMGHLGEIL